MGTGTRDEHLRQSFGHLWLIALGVLKRLGVKRSFSISWHFELFDRASGRPQITRVDPVAIAFALGRTFFPCCAEKLAEFLTHDFFHHCPCGMTNLGSQLLMKVLRFEGFW